MAKVGFDRGTSFRGPLWTYVKPEGATREYKDRVHGWHPRGRGFKHYDFDEEFNVIELSSVMVNTAANADLVQTGGASGVARAYFRVPRAGIITSLAFQGEDGVTQSGTDYLTFTGLNLQTAGTGNRALLDTTAHVNTTDTNALALNGGTNLTAKVAYDLALTATTASLYVKEGDILEVTATSTSNGAVVDAARIYLKIRSLPWGLKPTVTHTGGATTNVPIAVPVASSASGEALLQLSATNEAQTVRLDFGDQVYINPALRPVFSCRLKISGAAANVRFVWGLSTAYTATLDNTAEMAWFRIEGNSLALLAETDDATTDRDDQDCSFTMVADTYYNFKIDMTDTGNIEFWVDDNMVKQLSAAALTSAMLLQPMIAVQKASGTGTNSLTCDRVHIDYGRSI